MHFAKAEDIWLKSSIPAQSSILPVTAILGKRYAESSIPGEFQPQALTDPDVNVTADT